MCTSYTMVQNAHIGECRFYSCMQLVHGLLVRLVFALARNHRLHARQNCMWAPPVLKIPNLCDRFSLFLEADNRMDYTSSGGEEGKTIECLIMAAVSSSLHIHLSLFL